MPITNLDLFPTLAAVAKAEVPDDKTLDGTSLLPLLTKAEPLTKRSLFWHFPIYLQAYLKNDSETHDPIFRTRPGSAVRSGDWKLHQYFEEGKLELYNLKNDPSEQINLAQKHTVKTKELLELLNGWRKATSAPVPTELNPDYKPNP